MPLRLLVTLCFLTTTCAFGLIVCAFIAGRALGGQLMSHVVDRLPRPVGVRAGIDVAIAICCALLVPVIGELPVWMVQPLAERADSFAGTQLFVFGVLGAPMLLPTTAMGATDPLAIAALVSDPARGRPRSDGPAPGTPWEP